MTGLTAETLRLLQTLAASGLVFCAVMGPLCAAVLFGASGAEARRAAAAPDRAAIALALGMEPGEATTDALAAARAESEDLARRVAVLAAALEAAEREEADDAAALLRPPAPQALPKEAAGKISEALRPLAGRITVEVTTAPAEGARLYAAQLAGAIREAGVAVEGPYGILTTADADGLYVSAGEGDDAGAQVLAALQAAALSAHASPAEGGLGDILVPDGQDVRVYVAAAPPA